MNKHVLLALLFFSILLLLPTGVRAQSTVIYMPSNDVVAERTVGLRFTGTFKFNDEPAKKRFSSFVPRVIVGAGRNVEIGLNLTGNLNPGADATTIVPTVKWRFYNDEKSGVSAVAGNNFFIPVRNRKYDFGTYTYFQVSRKIKSTGTRVTAGSYLYSKSVVAARASRGGGQFAVEQAIGRRVTLTSEWITGRHAAGYFTPGLKVKLNKRALAYFAYPISNNKAAAGNHFFLAGIAYSFNY